MHYLDLRRALCMKLSTFISMLECCVPMSLKDKKWLDRHNYKDFILHSLVALGSLPKRDNILHGLVTLEVEGGPIDSGPQIEETRIMYYSAEEVL